jgi:pimeloyl-ACP methyl ester carboxylesterase
MHQLKLDKPVLVGHSLGGEELSYIGTHYPERVAGLIYLEAAYTYAFYDASGDYDASLKDLRQKIDALAVSPNDLSLMRQVETSLPQFQENLQRKSAMVAHPLEPAYGPPTAADKSSFAAMRKRQMSAMGGVSPEAELYESFAENPDGSAGAPTASLEAGRAISSSYEHFTTPITVPMLIITGYPQNKGAQFRADTPEKIAAVTAADANQLRHLDALRKSQPNAHVICIPNATHYIFISNEREVIDEIRNFLRNVG